MRSYAAEPDPAFSTCAEDPPPWRLRAWDDDEPAWTIGQDMTQEEALACARALQGSPARASTTRPTAVLNEAVALAERLGVDVARIDERLETKRRVVTTNPVDEHHPEGRQVARLLYLTEIVGLEALRGALEETAPSKAAKR